MNTQLSTLKQQTSNTPPLPPPSQSAQSPVAAVVQQQQQQQTVERLYGGIDYTIVQASTGIVLYPALVLGGDLYQANGNIVLGTSSDVTIGNTISLNEMYQTNNLRDCIGCYGRATDFPCCPPHATLDIRHCVCVCDEGFDNNTGCATSICYNGGTWSTTSSVCMCLYPYTASSYCAEIDCGANAVLDTTTHATCVCLEPFVGATCNETNTAGIQEYDNVACWNISSDGSQCVQRRNMGVSSCLNDSVCVCAPLYVDEDAMIARELVCPGGGCVELFAAMNASCCTGIVSCENYQEQAVSCDTQYCCSQQTGVHECLSVGGCTWGANGQLCLYSTLAANALQSGSVWKKFVFSCAATRTDGATICDETVQALQLSMYSQYEPLIAYSTIQERAWQEISRYNIVSDGNDPRVQKKIVLAAPGANAVGCFTRWRLALLLDSSFVSSTVWVCDENAVSTFTFNLVEKAIPTTPPPASDLGTVYTIFLSGTSWCLLDRALQPDQIYLWGATGIASTNVVAIDLNNRASFAPPSLCGQFIVANNMIKALSTGMFLLRGTDGYPIFEGSNIATYTVTTPPVYLDTNPSLPLANLGWATCQNVMCMIGTVRGTCATVACAEQLFSGASHRFAQCLPCLMAHVFLDAGQ